MVGEFVSSLKTNETAFQIFSTYMSMNYISFQIFHLEADFHARV